MGRQTRKFCRSTKIMVTRGDMVTKAKNPRISAGFGPSIVSPSAPKPLVTVGDRGVPDAVLSPSVTMEFSGLVTGKPLDNQRCHPCHHCHHENDRKLGHCKKRAGILAARSPMGMGRKGYSRKPCVRHSVRLLSSYVLMCAATVI
jgi:hypothetical protein